MKKITYIDILKIIKSIGEPIPTSQRVGIECCNEIFIIHYSWNPNKIITSPVLIHTKEDIKSQSIDSSLSKEINEIRFDSWKKLLNQEGFTVKDLYLDLCKKLVEEI